MASRKAASGACAAQRVVLGEHVRQTRGVRQKVAHPHLVLAVLRERRDELRDAVVERKPSPLGQHQHRRGRHGLGDRGDEEERVRPDRRVRGPEPAPAEESRLDRSPAPANPQRGRRKSPRPGPAFQKFVSALQTLGRPARGPGPRVGKFRHRTRLVPEAEARDVGPATSARISNHGAGRSPFDCSSSAAGGEA